MRKGDYTWVAAGGEGRANLRFIARREGSLFLAEPLAGLHDGPPAAVFDYLKSEGPSFFADIQAGAHLATPALRDALRQLAIAGVVTGEDTAALSAVLASREEPATPRAASSLEEDLAHRLPPRPRAGCREAPSRSTATARAAAPRWSAPAGRGRRRGGLGRSLGPRQPLRGDGAGWPQRRARGRVRPDRPRALRPPHAGDRRSLRVPMDLGGRSPGRAAGPGAVGRSPRQSRAARARARSRGAGASWPSNSAVWSCAARCAAAIS